MADTIGSLRLERLVSLAIRWIRTISLYVELSAWLWQYLDPFSIIKQSLSCYLQNTFAFKALVSGYGVRTILKVDGVICS